MDETPKGPLKTPALDVFNNATGEQTAPAAQSRQATDGPSRPEQPVAQHVVNARQYFPRGMVQPAGGYRFSLDPLLLASFARPKANARLLDLGTGCGVAALAVLLGHPDKGLFALGLDMAAEQVQAAQENARRLGLADRFEARQADIRTLRALVPPESADLALANPPYAAPGAGKACAAHLRASARAESTAGLADFLAQASFALANRGAAAVVFTARRLADLIQGCRQVRLEPKRLRMVHSRLEQPAKLVLLEAVKNSGSELAVEPPLILYEGQGQSTRLSPQALAFCPHLGAGREAQRPTEPDAHK